MVEKNAVEEEVAMLATYVQNYGPFKADRVRYWPFAARLIQQRAMSVEQLNEWLTSALPTPG